MNYKLTLVNYQFQLHRYVMETLRLLYMNNQFEKLTYIGTRFNALTK